MLGEIRTATAPQESSIRSTHIPENLLAVGSRQPGCRITETLPSRFGGVFLGQRTVAMVELKRRRASQETAQTKLRLRAAGQVGRLALVKSIGTDIEWLSNWLEVNQQGMGSILEFGRHLWGPRLWIIGLNWPMVSGCTSHIHNPRKARLHIPSSMFDAGGLAREMAQLQTGAKQTSFPSVARVFYYRLKAVLRQVVRLRFVFLNIGLASGCSE
ncbi:hypothetical protein PCANC_03019 [Puccinia coronata f. sp. avenae]|uniref:Uncharacterized protein n=1 Tax=Puccinia coronata f. sp. avenae TaxID=200324 RepID=A0A2N5W168_9BASI|nr:hypothetical protein PCANC_03019 [Puccinia coronata f. sp. avenae]